MRVEEIMTKAVRAVKPDDGLRYAAQLMWDNDCGCVPVVDDQNHVIAMLTDRDICMAAYTQGRTLSEMSVASAMSKELFCCGGADTVATAERLMQTHKVRRLPILDGDNRLIGILSLNDIALAGSHRRGRNGDGAGPHAVEDTLRAVCSPRTGPVTH